MQAHIPRAAARFLTRGFSLQLIVSLVARRIPQAVDDDLIGVALLPRRPERATRQAPDGPKGDRRDGAAGTPALPA